MKLAYDEHVKVGGGGNRSMIKLRTLPKSPQVDLFARMGLKLRNAEILFLTLRKSYWMVGLEWACVGGLPATKYSHVPHVLQALLCSVLCAGNGWRARNSKGYVCSARGESLHMGWFPAYQTTRTLSSLRN